MAGTYFTGPGPFLGQPGPPGQPAGARAEGGGLQGAAAGLLGFPGLSAGFGPPGVPPSGLAGMPPVGALGGLPPPAEFGRDLGPSFGAPGPAGALLQGGGLLGHGLAGLGGPYPMFPMGAAHAPPALPRLLTLGGTIPVPGAEPPPPLANGAGGGAGAGAGAGAGNGAGGAGGAIPVGAPAGVGAGGAPPPVGGAANAEPAKRRRAKGGAPKRGGRSLSGGAGARAGEGSEGEAAPAPATASPPADGPQRGGSPGGAPGTYVMSNLVKDNEVTKIEVPYSTGPLACPYNCGRTFNHASQRIIHVRKAHTGERPFVCKFDECGKAFYSSGDLRAHMRTHSGERPYACQVCGKAFRTRNALKTHVKSLHTLERPFLCTHPGCGMTYMTKIDLQRHMVRHQKQVRKAGAGGALAPPAGTGCLPCLVPADQLSARGSKAKAAAAAAAAAGNGAKEGAPPQRVAPAGRLLAVSTQAEAPARALAYFVPNEKHKGLSVSDFVVVSRSRLNALIAAKRGGGGPAGARGGAKAGAGGKKRVRAGAGSEADPASGSGRAGSGGPDGSAGGEDPGSGSGSRKRVRSGEGPAPGGLPRKRSVDSALKEAYDLGKPPLTFQTWKRSLTEAQIAGFAAAGATLEEGSLGGGGGAEGGGGGEV